MKYTLQHAFTMLELVLVIIILGIVSSIGAEIIANVYEGYIVQRAQHKASIKTELAATQIANRLAYAIPGTIRRKSALNTEGTDINTLGNANDNILQWVGADMDSFNAIASTDDLRPGWSGFWDLDHPDSSNTTIITPGSNLKLSNTIRNNLGLTGFGIGQIYFPSSNGLINGRITSSIFATNTINLKDNIPTMVEHYKLASSSYALVADGDLRLYYNVSPTIGADLTNCPSQLLLRNVTTFKFRGDGRTVRFKICVSEQIGDGNITICKEKAVF